jgi:hypothetical protein
MTSTPLGWTPDTGWTAGRDWPRQADLVLYFGATEVLAASDGPVAELVARFPGALVAGCSTAGEILGGAVRDGSVAALAVSFAHTRVRAESITVSAAAESFDAAAELGRRLHAPDLRHVLVWSDGLVVNGTALSNGFCATLPDKISVTGGLAGDGAQFRRTLVGLGADLAPNRIVAIGFYGEKLHVTYGSSGGWSAFGPRRLVTEASGNVLYALDGQPALALYRRYLGERAAGLPATGLLFPLQLLPQRDANDGLVRTILAVDGARQSLTFAGDIPEGAYVRLMKAGCDDLVDGAENAARDAADALSVFARTDGFAILVSCVGRKLVMGQRVEEEVETALDLLGVGSSAVGFYSYGEICPSGRSHNCELHNQTMTLTVFHEET